MWFYSKSSQDPDAQGLFDRIVAEGDTVNSTAREGYNEFVVKSKTEATPVWDLLLDFGPMISDGFGGALIKGKKLSASWSYANVNFTSGDYSQVTGLTGNGTTKYLGAGVYPDIHLTLGDTGIGVYVRSSAGGTVNIQGSNQLSSTQTMTLYAPWTDDKAYSDQNSEAAQINSGSALTGAVGFIFATRNTTPQHALYRNGSQVATSGTVGGTLPSHECFFFARNVLTIGAQYFSTHTMSFLVFTSGMNSTQAAALYTRVQALQTALGRNV